VDPLDERWIVYRSPDGSRERTMTKQLADLLYPDWVRVSDEAETRRRDDLDLDGGADGDAGRWDLGPSEENKENE
jgi:hypothetical protein